MNMNKPTIDNNALRITPFLAEWLAGGRPQNQLPISAVCNSHCLFCSNNLNPFPIYGGMFRETEDIKAQLSAMNANDDPIRMSDSLPGRISEGEALLHPRLFEILDLVRRKFFYNTLCFTTNGSMLDEDFLKKLAGFRPIEITLSMHSTNPELWSKIFGKSEDVARIAIASPPLIRKYRIYLKGTIVPLPRICGWDDIEQTYSYFVSQGAKGMILYQPGYTVQTPQERIADIECPMEEFVDFAQRMKEKYNVPLSPLPDFDAASNVAVETIIANTLKGNLKTKGGPYMRVIWLVSEAAYPVLEHLVAEKAVSAPNTHHVVAVKNYTYGGNIISAGLLMVDDLVSAGKAALIQFPDNSLFLVPSNPFDGLLRDLKGGYAFRISEELGVPVGVVHANGIIDMLLSLRLTKRRTLPNIILKETMDRFNIACSDDEKIETVLDMIASFPVHVPTGMLNRDQIKDYIFARRCETTSSTPQTQHFESLDENNVLCLERWTRVGNGNQLNRWTYLIRKESRWFIKSIAEGSLP